MKRRKLPPDKRLDWRDPNMSVFKRTIDGRVMAAPPELVRQHHAAKMISPYVTEPTYKDDPSYWWNKKNKH